MSLQDEGAYTTAELVRRRFADGGGGQQVAGRWFHAIDDPDLDAWCRNADWLSELQRHCGWALLAAIPPEGGAPRCLDFPGGRTREARDARWKLLNGGDNLYWHANLSGERCRKRLKESDVGVVHFFAVDIDPRKLTPREREAWTDEQKKAHREDERAAILERIRGFTAAPPPTGIIDSGNGFQVFWYTGGLKVGTDISADEARAINYWLACELLGDGCYSLDHLYRLPGWTNRPNKEKRAQGRGESWATLLEWDWSRVYGKAAFRQVKPRTVERTAAPVELNIDLAAVPKVQGVEDWNVPPRVKVAIVHGRDDEKALEGADQSRSAWVWYVACQCVRAGVPDELLFSVLVDATYRISDHVRERGGRRVAAYAMRQIRRAREEAAVEAEQDFIVDDKGKVLPIAHNVRVAVRKLGGMLRHNEFSGRDELRGIDKQGPLLDDRVVNHLFVALEEKFGFGVSMERLRVALAEGADRARFNPVLQYFEGLTWDGVARLDRWLVDYGGAKDTAYVRAVSPLPLLAAVRRQFEPGAKFDELLTLVSPQGMNKSSALRTLCPREEWFGEDLVLSADAKVIIEQTRGKLLVEIAELRGQRASAEQVKSMLSKQKDEARAAYGHTVEAVLRRWVAIGTTNEDEYLEDSTGNRRHWPVEVDRFDLERLRADRDQLWAEAVQRVKADEPIRLDPKHWDAAQQQQEERRTTCAIRERLETALDGFTDAFVETDVLWALLDVRSATEQGRASKRLADAMKVLRWRKPTTRPVIDGKRRSGWATGEGSRVLTLRDVQGARAL